MGLLWTTFTVWLRRHQKVLTAVASVMTVIAGMWRAITWLMENFEQSPMVHDIVLILAAGLVIVIGTIVMVLAIDKFSGVRTFTDISRPNPIRSALYGVGGKRTDVTAALCCRLLDHGSAVVNNHLFSDPAPNEAKDLRIEFADGSTVTIPEFGLVVLVDKEVVKNPP